MEKFVFVLKLFVGVIESMVLVFVLFEVVAITAQSLDDQIFLV
jgi:hypothetical protein